MLRYTYRVSEMVDIADYARDVERILAWFTGADDPEIAARFGVTDDDPGPTVDALASWIVDCEHLSVHPHPGEGHVIAPHSTTVVLSREEPPVQIVYSYGSTEPRLHHPDGDPTTEWPLDRAVVSGFVDQWLPHPADDPLAPNMPRTAEEWGDATGSNGAQDGGQ